MELSEMRKSRLRTAFVLIKDASHNKTYNGLRKSSSLKQLIKEKGLKTRFMLKQAFLKWNRQALNISVSEQYETSIMKNKMLQKLQLFISLKNVFNGRNILNKCIAFSKMKHHTKNLKGASSLYLILNQKIWTHLRFGFEKLSRFNTKLEANQDNKRMKLDRFVEIMKNPIQKALLKIIIYSQVNRQPLLKVHQKEGIIRLCVLAEDMKQNHLLHGFKMIELYNIYKRNQKSLYINLALKLYLLFDEKQKGNKKDAFDAIFHMLERNNLQQRLLEKLLRRSHQKNLSFFFNKFKNEIIQLKLNYSMVHLAIKDIIIAIEKLNKIQRSRKALAFRKLSLLIWTKQHFLKDNLDKVNFATTIEQNLLKESFSMLKSTPIESIDFYENLSTSEKTSDDNYNRKSAQFVNWLEMKVLERKQTSFEYFFPLYIYLILNRALKSNSRINSMIEVFEYYAIQLFEKLVYKRKFLAFAQIKYIDEKKQQRMRNLRMLFLSKMLKSLDDSIFNKKKIYFNTWKNISELYIQTVEEKMEIASKSTMKKFFQRIFYS